MALTISLPAAHPPRGTGLEVWMDRVLEKAERVQPGWDVDDVHDLRVAIRRSRTIAEALSEVNPGPGWRKLKKTNRDVFRALGELRDTQLERVRLKKLAPTGDLVRKHMLRLLSSREKEQRESADRALDDFDRKEWKKLARKLPAKARFFPLGSIVFQRLALARLDRAVELYQQARKRRSSVAWHRLRIALKHFRYVVENFLPNRYEVWGEDLKRMQDLLGEVHDLDVLRSDIRRNASTLGRENISKWIEKIDYERKGYLREFLAKAAGKDSPWLTWRAGFRWGHALVAAPPAERRTA